MSIIKILVVDDHQVVRESLVSSINKHPEFEVVDQANDGQEAIEKYEKCRPDLILMDLNMPNLNGIETSKILKTKYPDVKILILSMHDNSEFILDALSVGVEGYILKMSNLKEVIKAIKDVHKGGNYFDSNITGQLVDNFASDYSKQSEQSIMERSGLTQREIEIIRLLTESNTVEEISEKLIISLHTVKNHKRNILNKLDLKNTGELIAFAFRTKIVRI
ncbi:MAG: response regulator transcription factor [Melioribacteraceae bacterium]|nr:response regulator transcription factor [Melioribacteraceae bacterium]